VSYSGPWVHYGEKQRSWSSFLTLPKLLGDNQSRHRLAGSAHLFSIRYSLLVVPLPSF